MMRHREEFDHKKCLDIGSGTGWNGLFLSRLCCPKHVTLTDYTESLVSNLRHNVRLNRLGTLVDVT